LLKQPNVTGAQGFGGASFALIDESFARISVAVVDPGAPDVHPVLWGDALVENAGSGISGSGS